MPKNRRENTEIHEIYYSWGEPMQFEKMLTSKWPDFLYYNNFPSQFQFQF